MAHATTSAAPSVRADEAAHFGAMASDWWNPAGSSRMLHRLNPVRLAYLREQADRHWRLDETDRRALAGKRALDLGCGAGLLAEPLARLGAAVTGVDAAEENVAVARAHAEQSGLAIDYRHGGVEAVEGETFDLVTCLEVLEHVADPELFVARLAACLAPGGLLVLSTPNRTAWSRLALIGIGETVGGIPKGTHDWQRFIKPDELTRLVEQVGLTVTDLRGLAYDPLRGFALSDSLALDYFLTATI